MTTLVKHNRGMKLLQFHELGGINFAIYYLWSSLDFWLRAFCSSKCAALFAPNKARPTLVASFGYLASSHRPLPLYIYLLHFLLSYTE